MRRLESTAAPTTGRRGRCTVVGAFAAAALCGWLVLIPLERSSAMQATARVDERALVRVPASEPWIDTGLLVAAGDSITITAWGTVVVSKTSAKRTAGPGGGASSTPACERLVPREDVPALALVADVAPAPSLRGGGFAVGSKWSGKAPFAHATSPEGHLYLGVNHDSVSCDRSGYDSWALRNDSEGAFTAEVAVSHRR